MGLFQMCIFGHVHVFAKYPHWVSEIRMRVSEVNQLANNLTIQDQINIFLYSSFLNLTFFNVGYDWSSKTSQECLQHKYVDT